MCGGVCYVNLVCLKIIFSRIRSPVLLWVRGICIRFGLQKQSNDYHFQKIVKGLDTMMYRDTSALWDLVCPAHLPDSQPCWSRTELDIQSGRYTNKISSYISFPKLLHHGSSYMGVMIISSDWLIGNTSLIFQLLVPNFQSPSDSQKYKKSNSYQIPLLH